MNAILYTPSRAVCSTAHSYSTYICSYSPWASTSCSRSITPPLNRKSAALIYPQQVELKRTTEMDSRLSYLDLEVNISDRRFTTAVFDKRDGVSFHIVNFPHMDSNIPSKPAYGVYISQLVRIGAYV